MTHVILEFFSEGVTVTPASGLDAMRPSTTEEFTDFAKKLKNKISESEVS